MKMISIVVPVYNEVESVSDLIEQLSQIQTKLPNYSLEILLVDDGSTDGTAAKISAHKKPNLRLISFTRNYGQTAALSAGFDAAQGEIIVSLDGDLQNDPSDIPKLIQKVEEGFDIVSGWRVHRHDNIVRVFPSMIANRLISRISGVYIHDYGCTLKAYRKEFVQGFKLYGEMHRFIPIYGFWQGAKITEIPVNHHARKYGKSKYGMIRIFKVLLDLLTIKFLGSFSTKPIYFFGGIGSFLCVVSSGLFAFTLYQKIFLQAWVHRNPLFLVAIFIFLTGIQFLFFGILAEIMVRIYYEAGDKKTYRIKS